jgi:hypothetical protein
VGLTNGHMGLANTCTPADVWVYWKCVSLFLFGPHLYISESKSFVRINLSPA